ncbi:hypothetical protein BDK51DRAFT_46427 [Blyttiomyces helicus]|uniref:Uncharacterized protein n=1 Tax=Blyttiomyces helicus TaxID=388810 RepID=A0A4P9WDQ5_9FUNG|nr:hypothetical protein BDK51DRAFT_46426 [Blyttiomyces helicus]RKO90695.1 hypothetical protein BDK51DRAFT_46427 [Blyttiomyces helicus]|eukprot:RKO90694.1 hypothetical protein BDK51DRAFT_46426 [Blyttiomyces helicus]
MTGLPSSPGAKVEGSVEGREIVRVRVQDEDILGDASGCATKSRVPLKFSSGPHIKITVPPLPAIIIPNLFPQPPHSRKPVDISSLSACPRPRHSHTPKLSTRFPPPSPLCAARTRPIKPAAFPPTTWDRL